MSDAKPDGFVCKNCSKSFADKCHLARHLARKLPCSSSTLKCLTCGRAYATAYGLARHTKTCQSAAAPACAQAQPSISQQTQHADLQITQQAHFAAQQIGHQVNNVSLSITQQFSDPLPVDSAGLREVLAGFSPAELAAGQGGDAKVLARFMAGLVKRAHHRDPSTHNIRPCASRQDHVLVLEGAPLAHSLDARWETITLLEALRTMYNQVAGRLAGLEPDPGEIGKLGAGVVQGTVGAAIQKQQDAPLAMPTASRGEMAAHLNQLRAAAPPPAWTSSGKTRLFLTIPAHFLTFDSVIAAALASRPPGALADLSPLNLSAWADSAVVDFSRSTFMRKDLMALWVFTLEDPALTALVTPSGWKIGSAAEAADAVCVAFSAVLAGFLSEERLAKASLGASQADDVEALRALRTSVLLPVCGCGAADAGRQLARESRGAALLYAATCAARDLHAKEDWHKAARFAAAEDAPLTDLSRAWVEREKRAFAARACAACARCAAALA